MINTQAAFASLSAAGQKLAVALAKDTMTVEQVDRTLNTLGGKYKFNAATMSEFSSSVKRTSTKIKDVHAAITNCGRNHEIVTGQT